MVGSIVKITKITANRMMARIYIVGVLKKSKSINREVRKGLSQSSQSSDGYRNEIHCFNFESFATPDSYRD